MRFNKRGAELSINVIILAALGVLVLLILIAVFSRNIGQTTKKLEGAGSGPEKIKAIVTSMNDEYLALKKAIKDTHMKPISSSKSALDGKMWEDISNYNDIKKNFLLTQLDLCFGDDVFDAENNLYCNAGTTKYSSKDIKPFVNKNCVFVENGVVKLNGNTFDVSFYLCSK